jgi:hypothetical protein
MSQNIDVGVLYLLAQKPGNTDRWLHDPIREIDHWFHGIRSFFLDFQIPIIGFFLDFQTPIIGFIASRFLGQLLGFLRTPPPIRLLN